MKTVKLRPHHCVCVGYFRGHGYSAEFTARMTELVKTLDACPETAVLLVAGPDELCVSCPNLRSGECAAAEKVAKLDRSWAKAMGMGAGEIATWAEIRRALDAPLSDAAAFDAICKGCQWQTLCASIRSGEKGRPDGRQR